MFVLFRDLIQVQAMEQEDDGLQRGRNRQGLLPDFRLELPTPLGQPSNQLAELKVIGAAGTCYPRRFARRKRGVERWAEKLQAVLNRRCVQDDQIGPFQKRLDSYGPLVGLVVRAYQEGSKDLYTLLEIMADSQLRAERAQSMTGLSS